MDWTALSKIKEETSISTRHIFITKQQLCHTKNVKRKFNGAHSDHTALIIEFYLETNPIIKSTSKEDIATAEPIKKIDISILRNKELSNFQKKINYFFDELSPDDVNVLSSNNLNIKFKEHVVEKATELATKNEKDPIGSPKLNAF